MSRPKLNRRQRRQSLKLNVKKLNVKTPLPAPSAKKTKPLSRRKKKTSRVSRWRWVNPLFLWRWVSPPVRWAAGIFTFALTVATCVPLLTKVEISCGVSTDKTAPWLVPFTVTNGGILPIYNLKWSISPIATSFRDSSVKWNNSHLSNLDPRDLVSELDSGQKTTYFPWAHGEFGGAVEIPGDQLQSAEIVCSVDYQNVFHWRQKQENRFRCLLRGNGEYEWMSFDRPAAKQR